ncbi:uncharacterized protein K452DRAFT_358494 [Aplosporella prunicola CBS 121167]|uniref:RRM domain-containing protein n=1 Tax=Aplosporella prunicola CBS 121167 TaxID=1176127 RepID=A0A6A6BD90_9PEZI|nr:uncharacterized protein K452DRAFT_358494 [Aplosporella prunicola CBS 121167]KAF2142016.1 hypothetical protein K452DRAFT_358494 [Aplosporella prunicola CBS 121167]
MLPFNPLLNASFASSSDQASTQADADANTTYDPFTSARSPNPARNPRAHGKHVYTPLVLRAYQAAFMDKPTPDWDAKLQAAGVLGQPRDTWTAGYLARLDGPEKQERALDWRERKLRKEEKELQRERERFEREKREAEARFGMLGSSLDGFRPESPFRMFEGSVERHRLDAERVKRETEPKVKMTEKAFERGHADGERKTLTALSTQQAMGHFEYPISAQKSTKKVTTTTTTTLQRKHAFTNAGKQDYFSLKNAFTPLKYTGNQDFVPQKYDDNGNTTTASSHKRATTSSAKKDSPLTVTTTPTPPKPIPHPHSHSHGKKSRQASFTSSNNSSPLKHMISASDLAVAASPHSHSLSHTHHHLHDNETHYDHDHTDNNPYTPLAGPAAHLLARAQRHAGLSTLTGPDIRALTDLGAGMQLGELTVPTVPFVRAGLLGAAARVVALAEEADAEEDEHATKVAETTAAFLALLDGPPSADLPPLYCRPERAVAAAAAADSGNSITDYAHAHDHDDVNTHTHTHNHANDNDGARTPTPTPTRAPQPPYPTYPRTRSSTVRILNVPASTTADALLTFLEARIGPVYSLDVETAAPGFGCKTGRAVFASFGGAERMLMLSGVVRLGGNVLCGELIDWVLA